jgi:putative ABC transport system permease protein
MKKALLKDSLKQIRKTNKRFISILLMALLGVGFFAGIRATSPDMKKTMDAFLDTQNVYDIKVVSTLGLTDEDVDAISKVDGVKEAYGLYSEDVILTFEKVENVVKVIEYNENINNVKLVEGNVPQNEDECIIDNNMKTAKNVNIGDYIEIKENLDEDEDASFKNTKLKVVGVAKSPLYISRDRGTTTLGSGKVNYYIYVNKSNITSDIYTEIDVTANGAKEFNFISDEYDELVSNVEDNIDSIKETRQKARYEELVEEANQKLEDAQKEFDEKKADGEKEIQDAEKKITDGKKEIQESEQKIADSEKELEDSKNTATTEFANAEAELGDAQDQIIKNQETLDAQKANFETKKKEAEAGKTQIASGIQTIDTKLKELEESKSLAESVLNGISKINSNLSTLNENLEKYQKELDEANQKGEDTKELSNMIAYLNTQIQNLNTQKQELEAYKITQDNLNEINAGISECNKQKQELQTQLESINSELESGEKQLVEGQNKLNDAWNKVQSGKTELENKKNETNQKFADAEKEIQDGKNKLEEAQKDLEDGEKELEDAKKEFNEKIADAEAKLIDAREKVNDIENATWYIFNRSDNTGFNSYSQDSSNIEKIGLVFPVVFFIIATLISLTTMSRMVEEERVQIGTLKALGYNKLQIMSKYVIYSLLASVIGGLIGAIFGLKFFPYVIITMYGMMYDMPDFVLEFNKYYTIMGIGIMTFCIVGATIYTATKELVNTPAELMRPKSPKAGKRVLLERIPFIWKRLSFTKKVTVRNMFRYKKRFLMTVIGIAGCTALILAGFGLKDSISKIMDYQYVDIYNYDMLIGLKNTLTEEETNSLISDLESGETIEKCVKAHMLADTIENGDLAEDAQIFIIEDKDELDEVIKLKDLNTGEKITLNDDEIVLTDKLAQLIDVEIGDEITIKTSEGTEYKAKVGGITEHYISHYVYMTNTLYKKIFNEEVTPNVLLAKYSRDLTEDEEDSLSESLLLNSKVGSVTLSSYLMKIMDDTLSAMNIVVYILIISAGLLAFIVLYNLANVNISERIRELATIKVLGFYDKEVYDYVTREIILLTVIGIFFGLIFGYILNSFILGTCEIGILRFKRIIMPQSYLYAVIITVIFTYIVNFITYFSLKKIDMIESLKSVE